MSIDKAGWEVEGFIDRLTKRNSTNEERLVLEAISHLRGFSRDCDALRCEIERTRQESAWKPIATCPFVSAKRYLLCHTDHVTFIGWRYEEAGPWVAPGLNMKDFPPDWWMEVPEAQVNGIAALAEDKPNA